MKQKINIAQKVKDMKVGESFMVQTESERQSVCKIAKCFREAGLITFDVVTKFDGKQFKVAAI